MNNCEDYVKPFYYPDEAAAEWCEIPEDEYRNLKSSCSTFDSNALATLFGYGTFPETSDKPRFKTFTAPYGYGTFPEISDKPCFKKRVEQICHAIEIGNIPHARDGLPIAEDDHVARPRRTIIASDLKKWIEENHPREKPAFLFNQLERNEIRNCDEIYNDYLTLKNENAELEATLENARKHYRELRRENNELKNDNQALKNESAPKQLINDRRLEAFKFWLHGKGLQELNNWTKARLWQALSECDPNLFTKNRQGDDAFFKGLNKLSYKFNPGRSPTTKKTENN